MLNRNVLSHQLWMFLFQYDINPIHDSIRSTHHTLCIIPLLEGKDILKNETLFVPQC